MVNLIKKKWICQLILGGGVLLAVLFVLGSCPPAEAGIHATQNVILSNSGSAFIPPGVRDDSNSSLRHYTYNAPAGYKITSITWTSATFSGNRFHGARVYFYIDNSEKAYGHGGNSQNYTIDGGTWSNLSADSFRWTAENTAMPTVNGGMIIALQSTHAYASTEDLEGLEASINAAKIAALEARNKASNTYTAIENIDTRLGNVQTLTNNLQANLLANTGPEIRKIRGYNGATCTTTDSFKLLVEAPNATQFRTSLNGTTWSGWQSIGNIGTATGLLGGANTVYVQVRNAAGAIDLGQVIVFRI